MTHKGLWYENIPVYGKVVSPPHTNSDLQKQCAQLMIDAAAHLRDARPKGLSDARIYVFLSFPDMFDSMVEVAFEPNQHLFFNNTEYLGHHGDDSCWWEYSNVAFNRIGSLNLRIPSGFNMLGTVLSRYDVNWMSEPDETEQWVIGEIEQA